MSLGTIYNSNFTKEVLSKASKATCMEQDLVAYKGWLARGWSPWPPAKNFKP